MRYKSRSYVRLTKYWMERQYCRLVSISWNRVDSTAALWLVWSTNYAAN